MGDRKMGRDSGRLRKEINSLLKSAGAIAWGFTQAEDIAEKEQLRFKYWLEQGFHAGMKWLERHEALRKNLENVLPGVKTVISLAFSYAPHEWQEAGKDSIAAYAYGEDYHLVLKERLIPVINELKEKLGGEWRICIDSAPVPERYWAIKSGIAKPCANGCVAVKGAGSLCFLAEILTTIILPLYPPSFVTEGSEIECGASCNICKKICPGNAITDSGVIDSRKCINYLTIEHKEPLNTQESFILEKAGNPLFGCDLCLRNCPLNRCVSPTLIQEFRPHEVPRKRSPLRRTAGTTGTRARSAGTTGTTGTTNRTEASGTDNRARTGSNGNTGSSR